MSGPTEYQEHAALVQHIELYGAAGVVWWHTPLGGTRNKIEAARLRRVGTKAGVPDLLLLYNGHHYGLELKTASGRPSAAQMAFISALNAAGATASVAHGLDQAVAALRRWGLLR